MYIHIYKMSVCVYMYIYIYAYTYTHTHTHTHTHTRMTPFEFGQKTPMVSVSTGEAEGDMTFQNIPAPSLQGETGEG